MKKKTFYKYTPLYKAMMNLYTNIIVQDYNIPLIEEVNDYQVTITSLRHLIP